jgi:hypothetical protein
MSAKRRPRATWREKLEKEQEPRVVDTPPGMQRRYGAGKMLIPTPALVDALMRKATPGKVITVDQIRERLAEDFKVNSTCPLTTGIFVRIAAEAAEEYRHMGREDITPYWRVVKSDGSLNEKFPGGVKAQAGHLEDEGHAIEAGRGKKPPRVRDHQRCLVKL